VIDSTDPNGQPGLHILDSKQLTLGRYEELAQLTDEAGLDTYQSQKGMRELAAVLKRAEQPAVFVAEREGFHRVEHGDEIIQFFVWRGKIHLFNGKEPTLALRVLPNIPALPTSDGSLEEWQQALGDHVVANPYLLAAVCAAITSLLGSAFQLPVLILLLVGGSSQGKTTILRLIQSLLKSGDCIESFSGTTKGIPAYLGQHHSCPVMMDELRQADVTGEIIRVIFDVGNNASRKTSNASQASVHSRVLDCGLILANESTLAEIAATSRVRLNEGIGARILELPLQAPHGAFHALPPGMTAKQFAESLHRNSARFYGSVWNMLVPKVAKNTDKIRQWVSNLMPRLESELREGLPVDDPVTARLVRGLAAWACAGTLAVRFKLLNTDPKTVMAAIRLVLEERLQRNTYGVHQIAEQVISTLRAEIDRNANRFPLLATFHSSGQSGIYGYFRADDKDGTFLIFPSVFEQLVGQKYGTDAAARALKDAGFLKCDASGYQRQVRISGNGNRKRFYAIAGSIRFDGHRP
jgi:hypothetical protein